MYNILNFNLLTRKEEKYDRAKRRIVKCQQMLCIRSMCTNMYQEKTYYIRSNRFMNEKDRAHEHVQLHEVCL